MYDKNYDGKFNHLIPEISKKLTLEFIEILKNKKEFKNNKNGIDTSPLLNLSLSVFLSSIIHILDVIKETTKGEQKLIDNIELTELKIIELLKNLPFIKDVEINKI